MDTLGPAISELEQRLEKQSKEVAETKRAINLLLKMSGQRQRYTDVDANGQNLASIRADEYYGRPLAEVVGAVLSRNKAAGGGAMSINEIYDAMAKGGYLFETKSDENSKRGLRISLAKNSGATGKFHRVPGGNWGLREWYPNVKAERVLIENDNGSSTKADKRVDDFDADAEEVVVPKEQATDAEA
jgi:hypothetical protein